MKKTITFLILLFALISAHTLISEAQDPIKLEYVGRDMQGNYRWKADAEIVHKHDNVYEMTEKGEGVYSSFDGKVSWVAVLEYEETEDTIKPLKLDKKVFDAKGTVIRIETQRFDPDKKEGTCTHQEPVNNVSRTKKFKFDRDVVNKLSMGLYAQKMLETGKTSKEVEMVSEEPNMYNMELRVIDTETIDMNGGKKKAYKLVIDPQLGILNFAKAFFPKSYAWHSAEPKFEWLRYQGLEGDIKSVEVEVTAKDYKED